MNALGFLLFAHLLWPAPAQSSIAETSMALRQFRFEEFDTQIPAEAKPLLTELKHQLRDLALETLNEDGISSPSDATRAMITALRSQGIDVPATEELAVESDLGSVVKLDIRLPTPLSDLMAVTTTLSIPCGEDTSLYLFRRVEGAWRLILSSEITDYNSISAAPGDFFYVVSAPDSNHEFFVVTAQVSPWCSSNWQTLYYSVLRPGPAPERPKVLLSAQDSIFGFNYELTATAHSFRISYATGRGVDTATMIATYRVVGEEVEVEPLTTSLPEDFIVEWLELPWAKASAWASKKAAGDLEHWHAELASVKEDGARAVQFVQPCPASSQWQVGVCVASTDTTGARKPAYVTLAQKGDTFEVLDIATQRPPGCPGEAPRTGVDEEDVQRCSP